MTHGEISYLSLHIKIYVRLGVTNWNWLLLINSAEQSLFNSIVPFNVDVSGSIYSILGVLYNITLLVS